MKQIKFKKFKCRIELGQYSNGRIAIDLVDIKNDETVLCASINVPEVDLADQEVIIKNYSENEGVLDILVGQGIISSPIRSISYGYCDSPVCKLLNLQ